MSFRVCETCIKAAPEARVLLLADLGEHQCAVCGLTARCGHVAKEEIRGIHLAVAAKLHGERGLNN